MGGGAGEGWTAPTCYPGVPRIIQPLPVPAREPAPAAGEAAAAARRPAASTVGAPRAAAAAFGLVVPAAASAPGCR